MIPILMAGLGAARMVTPALAKLLIKKGIGKQVSKGTGRPIEKVGDLPPAAQKMFKSPKEVVNQKSSIKFAEAKAKRQSEGAKKAVATRAAKPKTPRVKNEDPTTLMGRTNKARRQATEAKKARKKEFYDKDLHFGKRSKYVGKKPLSDKAEKQIDNIMRGKEKGAEQARGAIKIIPKNQKGMRLPGKDETVKRMGGGKVYKKAGGSMKKGLKAAKVSAKKREPKVEKQRKKSKGGVGYTAMGLAAGAIPIAGAAIPAIAKGVKTIKAGMKASKRNKAGSKAIQLALPKPRLALPKPKPKPKPTETLTRPNPRKKLSKKPTTPESKRNPGKEKLKRRMEGEQRLRDSETGADIENMMEPAKFVRATKHSHKGKFKQKMKKQIKKAGGGSMKKGLKKIKALPKDKKTSASIKKKREALNPRDRIPQLEKLKRWRDEGVMGYNKYSPNAPLHPLDFKRSGGGKVKYRSIGGKVLNGNDITKMIYD